MGWSSGTRPVQLEAGMCLYGHDVSLETTPVSASLGWTFGKDRQSKDTAGFSGAETILEQLASPKKMAQWRVGFLVEKGPAACEGAETVDLESGDSIRKITSGLPSPTLDGQNIAMGLIKNGYHKERDKCWNQGQEECEEGGGSENVIWGEQVLQAGSEG